MAEEADINKLRDFMGLTNSPSVTDGQLGGAIDDATASLSGFTDDTIAIKYYSAYLLAQSLDWKVLSKSGDVSFQKSNPETYLKMFNNRSDMIGVGSGLIATDPKYDNENV